MKKSHPFDVEVSTDGKLTLMVDELPANVQTAASIVCASTYTTLSSLGSCASSLSTLGTLSNG